MAGPGSQIIDEKKMLEYFFLLWAKNLKDWKNILQYKKANESNIISYEHVVRLLLYLKLLSNRLNFLFYFNNLLEQNRTWICKPRYSFAGRGIYVLSGNSDLNSIFKFKVGVGNRLQHEPRLSGYLMQE
jgi:hypothetical protein